MLLCSVALLYKVEHGSGTDYSNAKPLSLDEEFFCVTVKDGKARFKMKKHYATMEEALKPIAEYIRIWEFYASLEHHPDTFRLVFHEAEIEDRQPIPGVINLRATEHVGISVSASLTVAHAAYPSPPSNKDIDPIDSDVVRMHKRFMDYRRGVEPLASMAYFVLTVLTQRAS